MGLVPVLGGVIFWRHHQTPTLSCSSVDGLYDVDHFLLVLQGPIDFVIVSSAQIDHDVFVAEEEHHGAGIVQLVPRRKRTDILVQDYGVSFNKDLHFVEIWNLCDVHQVDDSEVLYFLRDSIHHLVHLHTGWVPIVAKADDLQGFKRLQSYRGENFLEGNSDYLKNTYHNTIFFRENSLVHLPAIV